MNKKKIFDLNKQIPDGEGFNALPIAFVYITRAERRRSGSRSGFSNRASTALLDEHSSLSAKINER
jgi:hypothetical protein